MTGKKNPKNVIRPNATGHPVVVRLQDQLLAYLDALRKDEKDLPTRPEMLRRLLKRTTYE